MNGSDLSASVARVLDRQAEEVRRRQRSGFGDTVTGEQNRGDETFDC